MKNFKRCFPRQNLQALRFRRGGWCVLGLPVVRPTPTGRWEQVWIGNHGAATAAQVKEMDADSLSVAVGHQSWTPLHLGTFSLVSSSRRHHGPRFHERGTHRPRTHQSTFNLLSINRDFGSREYRWIQRCPRCRNRQWPVPIWIF